MFYVPIRSILLVPKTVAYSKEGRASWVALLEAKALGAHQQLCLAIQKVF